MKPRESIPNRMSVCQHCANAELVATALQKTGVSGVPVDVKSGLRHIWCKNSSRFPAIPCAKGTCNNCAENKTRFEGELKKSVRPQVLKRKTKYTQWVKIEKKLMKDGEVPTEREVDSWRAETEKKKQMKKSQEACLDIDEEHTKEKNDDEKECKSFKYILLEKTTTVGNLICVYISLLWGSRGTFSLPNGNDIVTFENTCDQAQCCLVWILA